MIKAECTWGDGPDVLLSITDDRVFLLKPPIEGGSIHGRVTDCCLDLTATEARRLGYQLLHAANYADELDQAAQWADETL